jgi:hypothetical protein
LERQALQSQVERLKQAADQANAEMAEREKQIAKAGDRELRGILQWMGGARCTSQHLGNRSPWPWGCGSKRLHWQGDVATACKHWQGLLVEIEKMGTPLSESRGDIEELMRQNRCEVGGNSTSNSDHWSSHQQRRRKSSWRPDRQHEGGNGRCATIQSAAADRLS